MRYLIVGLVGLGLVLSFGALPAPERVTGAPLAQATATPTLTPTPTPTLPPVRDFGDGWGVQALPRANVNCVVRLEQGNEAGGVLNCVSGTPVPAP